MRRPANQANLLSIGWREWVALPELGLPAVKAKVDTGACTSALHTFMLEPFEQDGRRRVRFGVHPLQGRRDVEVFCVADVVDERYVRSSNGQRERRLVIRTPLRIGPCVWPIEITLANRDTMNFRMLLGRMAMQGHVVVNPGSSYLSGKALAAAYRKEFRQLRKLQEARS